MVLPPWWILKGVKPAGPERDMGSWKAISFSPEQQEQFGIDEDGKVLHQSVFDSAMQALQVAQAPLEEHPVAGTALQALPPWWITRGVKPAGPERDMGTWRAISFSPEQQEQFGVDEAGKVLHQSTFDEAIKALEAAKARETPNPAGELRSPGANDAPAIVSSEAADRDAGGGEREMVACTFHEKQDMLLERDPAEQPTRLAAAKEEVVREAVPLKLEEERVVERARQDVVCGGKGPTWNFGPTELLAQVRKEAEDRARAAGWNGVSFKQYEAVSSRTQVVSGTNHFCKVKVDDNVYAHITVYQPLGSAPPSVLTFSMPKTLEDPL